MGERWSLIEERAEWRREPLVPDDEATWLSSGDVAVRQLEERIASGHLETWLRSDNGRLLAITTNTSRALVMLLRHGDDPGEHVVDLAADDIVNDGFALSNGQVDRHRDRDTVTLAEALAIVSHIVDTGTAPLTTTWCVDRDPAEG